MLADPHSGDFIAVERTKNGVSHQFAPYGSAIFVVGAKADKPTPPEYGKQGRALGKGWTVRRVVSHSLGEDAFSIQEVVEKPKAVRLGDWRPLFGEHFSGKALYELRFDGGRRPGRALLDLGKVGWTCQVRFNGKELPGRFFGPFCWEVDVLPGENVLEVTVANMLANAVSAPVMRARVAAKYPPNTTYDPKQRAYDLENHESGLIGPVVLRYAK